MKNQNHKLGTVNLKANCRGAAGTDKHAFTLPELLVVLAVLGLLACVALPAFAKVKPQTALAQCSDNLRRFAMAIQIYANDSNDQQPQTAGASWAWDIPAAFRDRLTKSGMQRQNFYCPSVPEQNNDGLWNYLPSQYGVIGYALTLPGSIVSASYENITLTPVPPKTGLIRQPAEPSSQRVLVADATLCAPVSNPSQANAASYNWTSILGGLGTLRHRTPHMNTRTNLPLGGNVGMVDGHVEWRNFSLMLPRTTGGSPVFWW